MPTKVIGIPGDPGGANQKLDGFEVSVGGEDRLRERDQVAGVGENEVSEVKNTDPATTHHGLVVRPISVVSPQSDFATKSALGSLLSDDLDGTPIASGKTGKLLKVTVASSVAAKWVVKTRDGAVEVILGTIYTSGVSGGSPTGFYKPESKDSDILVGAGVDENFRVTVTNLDAKRPADFSATIEWDEV